MPVFAGKQDVRPPKGQDVAQELGIDREVRKFPLSDRFAQMGGSPVNNDGGELFPVSRPTVYRTLNRRHPPQRTILPPTGIDPERASFPSPLQTSLTLAINCHS